MRADSCFVHNRSICQVEFQSRGYRLLFLYSFHQIFIEGLLIARSRAEHWKCSGEQPEKAPSLRDCILVGNADAK